MKIWTALVYGLLAGAIIANDTVDFDQHLKVSKEEYAARREALRQKIDKPIVIMGHVLRNRINDTDHEFRQESNFYYLTGYEEPDAFLILSKEPFTYKDQKVRELIFVKENNLRALTWVGKRLGVKGAMDVLGIEMAAPLNEAGSWRSFGNETNFDKFMRSFVQTHPSFHLHTPIINFQEFGTGRVRFYEHYRDSMLAALNPLDLDEASNETPKVEILPQEQLRNAMSSLRSVKSPREIEMLQRAVDITLSGHGESLKIAKDVKYEYQVEAAIEYAFKYNGAAAVGYNSIVGCGPNGTILHYDTNRESFNHQQMFVLDAGAEYRNYTADITRSFPADGTFSPQQRQIYELVLAAQNAGAVHFKAGSDYARVDAAINKVLVNGLVKLGLIEAPTKKIKKEDLMRSRSYLLNQELSIEGRTLMPYTGLNPMIARFLKDGTELEVIDGGQFKQLCPHGWGHSVGLEVHDPGAGFEPFQKGMVYTIEPGIYISDRIDFELDEGYMNIGVRIEDMWEVTDTGNRHMSAALPREVDALEAFMKQGSHLLLRKHNHQH